MPTPPSAPLQVLRTLPGRLLVLSGAALLVVALISLITPLPAVVEMFRKVASLALRLAVVWLAVLLLVRNRRRFLWRVRRKLILSYVFLGFVPVLLVVVFSSVAGFIVHANTAAYLIDDGLDDLVGEIQRIAIGAAAEIEAAPSRSQSVIDGHYQRQQEKFGELSLAVVPLVAQSGNPLPQAGAWQHLPAPPASVPVWVRQADFAGTLGLAFEGGALVEGDHLLIRAVASIAGTNSVVIVDLPVDTDVSARLDESTGARIRGVQLSRSDAAQTARPLSGRAPAMADTGDDTATVTGLSLLRQTVVFMDYTDWETGSAGRASVSLDAPLGRLYDHMSSAQASQFSGVDLLNVLVVLGVLLLVVQGAALFFGAGLGRQITSAVHELFLGTERVQQGDFTHRVSIDSQDQLGDLADSFNRMSASIEHLLHVQREKQRLDDELRIARDIQQSLLPDVPPVVADLTIADLCVPAREVGGDYYDFFLLGPRQLGVLVADVSGKGTSAALYMAELKGLMFALSHLERSPRELLIRVNRLLADHLDNRSFITMTYAVIDLEARTLTHARAGHTPLIVANEPGADVIVPDGMVLGLRLPGAGERFETLLEEHTRPIRSGDAIVLYTDGITEAMDVAGELFTDAALSRVVAAHHMLDAAGIRERVLREVKAFVGEAEQHDDMTMVVIKVGDLG